MSSRLAALQAEYWGLLDERASLERRVLHGWSRLSFEPMHQMQTRFAQIDDRLGVIRKLKSYPSISKERDPV